jgi:S1-C subfamily serine protease
VPASDFKALHLFGYEGQGLLFSIEASDVIMPAATSLPDQSPFDAFGYMSTDKSWQVFGLAEDSALSQAGLRTGDRITKFNDAAYDPAGLRAFREQLADDAAVSITFARGGQTMQISAYGADLNVLALFANQDNGMLFGLPETRGRVWLGANVLLLNNEVAQAHHVTADSGALVLGIMPDSPAASAGLQLNDIITRIGDEQVDTTHSLSSLLSGYQPGQHITLDVLRGSNHVDIEATLSRPEMSGELPALIGEF